MVRIHSQNGWHFENNKHTEFGYLFDLKLRPSTLNEGQTVEMLADEKFASKMGLTSASVDVSTSTTRIMICVALTWRRERQSFDYVCMHAV